MTMSAPRISADSGAPPVVAAGFGCCLLVDCDVLLIIRESVYTLDYRPNQRKFSGAGLVLLLFPSIGLVRCRVLQELGLSDVAFDGRGIEDLSQQRLVIRSEERRVGKECRSRWS